MSVKLLLSALACILLLSQPVFVQAGFMPYGRIFKATQDDRSYITQAHDSRLQLTLHKTLLLDNPSTLLEISSYVFLGHGFLVGEVGSEAERENLINKAKTISELSGLSYFLPLKSETENKTGSTLEIKLKGIFEPDYPASKLTIKVVQDTVVVMGVLQSDEQEQVCDKIRQISGSDKIINFLQAPKSGETKRKRIRPLRNLFE
ncbi:hypothetical protein [Maridesulfovibrio sp.]|uniref:hypothetical protein n=1 Tax=Maridesulfovibrio sp. TaxID=2795000 RepID=UPI002A189777|nr:hypothetical protein [Maridesulfovibrio sp.]